MMLNKRGEKIMNKKNELALSYAHGNKKLSNMISNELDCMFDKAFFKDELQPAELAPAKPFVPPALL